MHAPSSGLIVGSHPGRPAILHPGVNCDLCGQIPLRGPRYHCLTCSNKDFCSSCWDSAGLASRFPEHTASHVLSVFRTPAPALLSEGPTHYTCSGCTERSAGPGYGCSSPGCTSAIWCSSCEERRWHDVRHGRLKHMPPPPAPSAAPVPPSAHAPVLWQPVPTVPAPPAPAPPVPPPAPTLPFNFSPWQPAPPTQPGQGPVCFGMAHFSSGLHVQPR